MISIITPNLNNAKYLEDNILSIMKLEIPFEHIIVDGGSIDGSLEVIKKYPHIKLINQTEKTGMYGAIDLGINSSQGEILSWINADDRIIKDGYEKMYRIMKNNNLDLAYSDGYFDFINQNKKIKIKGKKFGIFFLKHGCMPAIQPSMIFTKNIYKKIGGFDYKNFKICGDLDLFVRIANEKGSKFGYVKTSSSIFIKRGNSLGDLNHSLYLEEMKNNNLPIPNLFAKILFFILKFI